MLMSKYTSCYSYFPLYKLYKIYRKRYIYQTSQCQKMNGSQTMFYESGLTITIILVQAVVKD